MQKVIRYQRLVLAIPCLFITIFLLSGCGGGGGGVAGIISTPTFTVTYNGNGNTFGSVPVDAANYEQGQNVTVLGNSGFLVKTGFAFSGWNTQADGLGTTYGATFTMEAADVALYAKWAPIVQRFAYVANKLDNTISQYEILSGGSLTSMATPTIAAGTWPSSVTVDPSGRYVYVANDGDGTIPLDSSISQYMITPDGSLISMPTATVPSGSHPRSVTVDPSGTHAYVANSLDNTISQYTITPDGSLTSMTTAATGGLSAPQSVMIDPSGKYAYVANFGGGVSQYTIGADGLLSAITPTVVVTGSAPQSVTIDPSGRYVYVANFGSNNVSQYAIGSDGALTPIAAAIGAGTRPISVAVDPTGQYVYVANSSLSGNFGSISQYTIGTSGALTAMTPATVAAGVNPASVTVDPTGQYAYVANSFDGVGGNSVSQYTIGPTGALAPMIPEATVPAGESPVSVTTVGR
jgi:6-phosphogluconolactonase